MIYVKLQIQVSVTVAGNSDVACQRMATIGKIASAN
jgi:hypothetical protein